MTEKLLDIDMDEQPRLKHDSLDVLRARTPAGMAHWAGTYTEKHEAFPVLTCKSCAEIRLSGTPNMGGCERTWRADPKWGTRAGKKYKMRQTFNVNEAACKWWEAKNG